MSGCCQIDVSQNAQRKKALTIVLWINVLMFVVQFSAAISAHSSSLLADSFDMFGDVVAYSLSLYALQKSMQWMNVAAMVKGGIILFFGALIVLHIAMQLFHPEYEPIPLIMFIFGFVGLMANGVCFYLLTRHKDDDVNMRSVWICARNDIIGNIAVIISALLVYSFHSKYPDMIIAALLATLFFRSAGTILKEATVQYKKNRHSPS